MTHNQIWSALVDFAGAEERGRTRFLARAQEMEDGPPSPFEHHFGGYLGAGGKIHHEPGIGWYVSCYSEQTNPLRETIIKELNKALGSTLART